MKVHVLAIYTSDSGITDQHAPLYIHRTIYVQFDSITHSLAKLCGKFERLLR